MSTDVTSLVLEVDSSQAKTATSDLQRLTKAGKTLEEQLNKEQTAHERVARAADKAVRARDSKGRFIGAQRDYNRTLQEEIQHIGSSNRLLEAKTAIAKRLGVALGVAAAAVAGFVTYSVIRNTIEAEEAQAQLEARLRSTAGAAGITKDALIQLADNLQAVTRFEDDAIIEAEGLLLTFTKVGRDVFPQAMESALNLSTALKQDLQPSIMMIGKALNDPVKGVAMLGRAGVQFSKDQKALIKSLVETNRLADAQSVILGELETQMGGAARAARGTLGGAIENLKNQFGNLMEGDSGGDGVKGATASINELADLLGRPDTKQAFNDIIQLVFTLAGAFTAVTTESVSAWGKVQKWVNHQAGRALGFKGYDGGTDTAQMKYDEQALRDRAVGKRNEAANLRGRVGGDHPYARQLEQEAIDLFREMEQVAKQRKSAYDIGLGNDEQFRAGVDAYRASRVSTDPRNAPTGSGGGEDDKATKAAERAAEAARKRREQEFQSLKDDLATEEEAIAASYAERERIIAESAAKGSEQQIELSRRSAALRDEELAALAEERGREVEELRLSLRTEEEAIQESYQRRLAIIDANTTLTEEGRQKLRDKLKADNEADLEALAAAEQAKRDQLWQGLMTEQEMMVQYHEMRKQEILNATYVTEMERQELLRREESRFMKESADRERQRISMITGSAGDMFGALGQLMAQYAQGSDKQSKKMFKVAQAFSIAQAIISIATGISKAQELGYPMNIFESVRVAAVGAAQIATIKSQKYAGAYDEGGDIPAGKWGWVGEHGPERVRGPVRVTGRKTSERYMGGGGGDNIGVTTNVYLASDGTATSTTSTTGGDAEQARQLGNLVSAKVREELVIQMKDGGILSRSNRRN